MFYGSQNLRAEDRQQFLHNVYDSQNWESERVSLYNDYNGYYFRIHIYPYSSQGITTSSGSYLEFYLPPVIEFFPDFDPNTDCRFSGSSNSALCTVTKTSNYVHIIVKSTASWEASYPNYFPINNHRYIHIYRIKFPRSSSAKYPHMIYARLFSSSAVGADTFINQRIFTVAPRRNELSSISLEQHGNIYNQGFKYAGFFRFESKNQAGMNYVLQENEKRILSIKSRYGIRGLGTIANQDPYPCTSNIDVKCYYFVGQNSYNQIGEWERIDIFFPSGGENSTDFHVIIPDSVVTASDNRYHYFLGVYNELTKDIKYYYRSQYYRRYNY